MKLSTRARYGTRALLDLAIYGKEKPISLKDIAIRQQISLQYLEHLMTPLIAAGMVRSVRGPRGGVLLAKLPEKIKLSEIVQLLEGSIAPVDCLDNPNLCVRSASCATRDSWDEMKQAMDGVLKDTTLQNMVERQKQKDVQKQEMYYI